MIWSIAIIMHTKGKGIHVEFRSEAQHFIFASSLLTNQPLFLPKSLQKPGCCHLSSTLFTTAMCPVCLCMPGTTARTGSSVLDKGNMKETRDRDTGFAWKHAELLLVERGRATGARRKDWECRGALGEQPWSKCRSNGGGRVDILMDSSNFNGY